MWTGMGNSFWFGDLISGDGLTTLRPANSAEGKCQTNNLLPGQGGLSALAVPGHDLAFSHALRYLLNKIAVIKNTHFFHRLKKAVDSTGIACQSLTT
jgi:hypothetical protein